MPVAIAFVLAVAGEIDPHKPGKPVLLLSAPALMALAGFATPRSFLYLTPVAAALITMLFDRQLRQAHNQRAIVVAAITLAASVSAIANLMAGTHPFKRNSVVPYQAIFDFIDRNANGSALVILTEPVVPWILRLAGENRCAGYFLDARRCLASGRHYDSIFVISGHHDRSTDRQLAEEFNGLVAATTSGRNKLASVPIGRDDDAALKSWLTGVPLEQNILTLDYYR